MSFDILLFIALAIWLAMMLSGRGG